MSEGYSVRVLDNGIVVFRLPTMARHMVDEWIEDLTRLGQAWIGEEVVLLLVDMRGAGITTPYLAAKLRAASELTPATSRIRTAFLLDPGPPFALSGRNLQILGPLLGERRAFLEELEAIGWLSELL